MKQKKQVILAVGAHPDDMDFTASGTIAKMVMEGWDAYYLICTDGSRGSRHHKTTHEELTKTRREEQEEAGKIVGLKDIFYLDHRDTQLPCNPLLKAQIVRVIRITRPQVVITMDPMFHYATSSPWNRNVAFVNHTDHRAAGLATMDAVFPLSRDRLSFPEHEQQGLMPHKVSELWFTSFEKKEYVVDITKTIEKKIKALAAHKSQFDNFAKVKEEVLSHAKHFADEEEFEYAESFIRLVLD
ncbi:MAG: PIG-L family deacetylase [Candidatus Levybacteria bacterium]|nr:PIG-L family deacetylase [Candidatus Levybacteria bacterium]